MKQNRKSIIVASIAAFTTFALPMAANAQLVAQSGANAGATSIVDIINNSPTDVRNSATGGQGIGTATVKDVNLTTGGSTAGVNAVISPTTTMNFEASKVPLQTAGIPSATPGQAQLFFSNGATNPPTIAGIALSRFGQLTCKQTYTRSSSGSAPKTTTGGSGDTTVRVVLNPDYNNKRFANDDTAPEVSFGLPGSKADVVCVGTIMVQAKSADVDINVVDLDAAQYALSLAGYKRIYLVSPESAIGGALGVDSEGRGFGVGASGVGLAGAVTAALGLSGGKNSGATTPTARVGTTYLVLAEPNAAQGASATMSTRDFDAYHARMTAPTAPAGVGVREAAGARK